MCQTRQTNYDKYACIIIIIIIFFFKPLGILDTEGKKIIIVRSRIPELYGFCLSAYSQPSLLFFGSGIVSSEEGSQQGDLIGRLLFCNTIHPLLSSLQAHLTLGFLATSHWEVQSRQ